MSNARRAGATSATTLIGLALTVVFVHALAPDWIRRLGLDVWNLPAAIAATRSADEELATLNAQEDQLFREIQLGNQITSQIAAGTLSLRAAVDEMEPILQNREGFAVTIKQRYRAATFRLAVAHYLISRVPAVMNSEPLRQSTVLTQLEYEYAQMK
jgi:hypothetical protein